jgi:hypothetical protein
VHPSCADALAVFTRSAKTRMSTQAVVKTADTEVADGEATVITAHFPGEHAIHVVCSCCGTLSTDTYAVEARDGGMGEMFVARWNANCRANAHAKYGEHPAARTGGA